MNEMSVIFIIVLCIWSKSDLLIYNMHNWDEYVIISLL